MEVLICIFIIYIHSCYSDFKWGPEKLCTGEDLKSAKAILNITADIIKDTDRLLSELVDVQHQAAGNAAFEVGYLTYVIHEKYRRMVDKYNVSHYMSTRLYLTELILYLDEIERHYWDIIHVSNMLHEVENKYAIKTEVHEEYEEISTTTLQGPFPEGLFTEPTRHKKRKRTRFKIDRYTKSSTPSMRNRRPQNKWWSREYGWEPEEKWFN